MITQFNTTVEAFNAEYEKYAIKPTKASSKRLRDLINQMQKQAVATKKDLILSDAAGYQYASTSYPTLITS